jgi:hypothetical protein
MITLFVYDLDLIFLLSLNSIDIDINIEMQRLWNVLYFKLMQFTSV